MVKAFRTSLSATAAWKKHCWALLDRAKNQSSSLAEKTNTTDE
jgi:hypothetical protein